jgi:hypothetical protein
MIPPNPRLKIDIAEKLTRLLVSATHPSPSKSSSGTMNHGKAFETSPFSTAC